MVILVNIKIGRSAKEYGKIANNNILSAIKAQGLDQSTFASSIGRSKASMSNTMANIRDGKANLATIVDVANALDLALSEVFIEGRKWLMPNIILTALADLQSGTTFELPDLVPSYWAKLSHGERRQLGKMFYDQVISGDHPRVQFKYKNPNAQYVKN